PLSTQTPLPRRHAYVERLSITSAPREISSTCECRAFALSHVTMMGGGLGLFLDPGSRPRGRRAVLEAPSPSFSVCWVGF
ncbi:hypothetical protein VIGAN_02017000, partial [Vigna angularis var. angularis]